MRQDGTSSLQWLQNFFSASHWVLFPCGTSHNDLIFPFLGPTRNLSTHLWITSVTGLATHSSDSQTYVVGYRVAGIVHCPWINGWISEYGECVLGMQHLEHETTFSVQLAGVNCDNWYPWLNIVTFEQTSENKLLTNWAASDPVGERSHSKIFEARGRERSKLFGSKGRNTRTGMCALPTEHAYSAPAQLLSVKQLYTQQWEHKISKKKVFAFVVFHLSEPIPNQGMCDRGFVKLLLWPIPWFFTSVDAPPRCLNPVTKQMITKFCLQKEPVVSSGRFTLHSARDRLNIYEVSQMGSKSLQN